MEYTHYRVGALVYTVDNILDFDGRPDNVQKDSYVDTNYTKKRYGKQIRCTGRFYNNRGINKAKRYCRNLKSYNKE